MANNVILKKSSVSGKVPLASDLVFGELALNYADGLLYYKNADGTTIGTLGGGGGASGVSSFNTRTGAVSLLSSDVDTALGYNPANQTDLSALSAQVGSISTALSAILGV